MPSEPEPQWLDPREDRAWRAFMHAHHQLSVRLNRLLTLDSQLTLPDYEILAVLSEHPGGRMPAQELCTLLRWEKSRLSHQVRRMQDQGLIVREPNPADGRRARHARRPQRTDPVPPRRRVLTRGRSPPEH
jgi:DNA-binding MarR family transcriptional regulator